MSQCACLAVHSCTGSIRCTKRGLEVSGPQSRRANALPATREKLKTEEESLLWEYVVEEMSGRDCEELSYPSKAKNPTRWRSSGAFVLLCLVLCALCFGEVDDQYGIVICEQVD